MSDSATTDWSAVPLNEQYNWKLAKSANGSPYQIGTPKQTDDVDAPRGGAADPQLNALGVQPKAPFDIQVNWTGGPPPAAFTNFKKPTAQETATTSITSYNISTNAMFNYAELSFSCTEDYNFYFYDATGDYYQNNVFWPRNATLHYVVFFSSNPTIVRITGS